MLRWTRADVFAMSDLKTSLTRIEEHALNGRTVVLTRHGRPTYALLRLDELERLAAGTGERVVSEEARLYDVAFERGEREIAAGEVEHWPEVKRRIAARLSARERPAVPAVRTTRSAPAARPAKRRSAAR